MTNVQTVLIHSQRPTPVEVHKLLSDRGFSIQQSHSWKDTERAYYALDRIKYVFVDISLCRRYGWEKFVQTVRTKPTSPVLICYHPKHTKELCNFLDQPYAGGKYNAPNSNKIAVNPRAPLVVGKDQKFLKALELADRYARHDISVLITGETGTGKDVISNYIHSHSSRQNKPFVPSNITAIPETLVESELFGYIKGAFTGADKNKKGLIEAAEGGTLFLDEIGDLTPLVQLKLLRFLESREFYKVGDSSPKTADVRIIAATNKDLHEDKDLYEETNGFRKDLYYRVNSARIMLPPLRERGGDIILLAEKFIDKACLQAQKPLKKISNAVKALLLDYPWPGNIREIKNTIESAVMVSDGEYLSMGDLPMQLQQYATRNREKISPKVLRNLEEAEWNVIRESLKEANGNKEKAAKLLGISIRTLYRKLEKFAPKTE